MAEVLGTAGDDRLVSTDGDDAIWGGFGGVDTAVFNGPSSEYSIVQSDNGAFYVTQIRDGETLSVDKVRDVEFFEFDDVTYSLEEFLEVRVDPSVKIQGTAGADTLRGGSGNDVLVGDVAPENKVEAESKAESADDSAGSGGADDSASSGGAVEFSAVRIDDFFDANSGSGGYVADLQFELTEDLINGGDVSDWTLDLDVGGGTITNLFLRGYNASVDFDIEAGIVSTLDQSFQLQNLVGTTITLGVQVDGAGFDLGNISAVFSDLDEEDAAPDTATAGGAQSETAGENGSDDQITDTGGEADLSALSVNDFFNANSGTGGYVANLELELTDELINGGSVSDWTLDIDVGGGTITNLFLEGYNASVDFDIEAGTISTLDQSFQLENLVGTTLQLGIQVDGAGFDLDTISAVFRDLDEEDIVLAESAGEEVPDVAVTAADVLVAGSGDDKLFGGVGDDWLAGGTGADVLDGGEGVDFADYSRANYSVKADLSVGGILGEAANDTFESIEGIKGSTNDDVLWGDQSVNHLLGHDGDDLLVGAGGGDHLWGGHGNDTAVFAGEADDYALRRIEDFGRTEDAQYQYDYFYELTNVSTGETSRVRDVEVIEFDNVTFDTVTQEFDLI